jgi:hypothetical protein
MLGRLWLVPAAATHRPLQLLVQLVQLRRLQLRRLRRLRPLTRCTPAAAAYSELATAPPCA